MPETKQEHRRAIIRDMRIGDYDSVVALWEAAGLPYRPRGRDTRGEIERQMGEPTAVYLVAEMGGELVGAVLGTHDGRKGWVNRLAVYPAFRRRGLAGELLAEAERRFASLGIGIFTCLVEDWNVDSKLFFEKSGYQPFSGITYYTKKLRPDV